MPKILDICVDSGKDYGVMIFFIFLDEPIAECSCFEFCKEYEANHILVGGKRIQTTNNKYSRRLRELILQHGKVYGCGLIAEHVMEDIGIILGHVKP